MDTYKNPVRVAAHRGNSTYTPENTLVAFKSALALPIDQLEVDLHMTKDGQIVMIHDHKVDRTTNGSGLVRDFTLKEIQALDAGYQAKFGDQFAGTQIPTFEEFLEFLKDYPEMTVNVELKDYPTADEAWALESCHKALGLIERYGIKDHIWINCWSGQLLEYIDKEWGHTYKLHGYWPFALLHGSKTRHPYDYLHCVCLFGTKDNPVVDKEQFDIAKSYGVEPWTHYGNDALSSYEGSVNNGTMLITANDPMKCINYLRSRGLHD